MSRTPNARPVHLSRSLLRPATRTNRYISNHPYHSRRYSPPHRRRTTAQHLYLGAHATPTCREETWCDGKRVRRASENPRRRLVVSTDLLAVRYRSACSKWRLFLLLPLSPDPAAKLRRPWHMRKTCDMEVEEEVEEEQVTVPSLLPKCSSPRAAAATACRPSPWPALLPTRVPPRT